jgi:uncharacterized protein YjcR
MSKKAAACGDVHITQKLLGTMERQLNTTRAAITRKRRIMAHSAHGHATHARDHAEHASKAHTRRNTVKSNPAKRSSLRRLEIGRCLQTCFLCRMMGVTPNLI